MLVVLGILLNLNDLDELPGTEFDRVRLGKVRYREYMNCSGSREEEITPPRDTVCAMTEAACAENELQRIYTRLVVLTGISA